MESLTVAFENLLHCLRLICRSVAFWPLFIIVILSNQLAPNIQCSSVSVSFLNEESQSKKQILDDLDIEIQGGEIVALLGQSGCGKSTLLRAVAGLQTIDQGKIAIGQQTIAVARSQLSFVFQEPALLPWRTAIENVQLPLQLQSPCPTAVEIKSRSQKLLETVGFADSDLSKLPPQLSGGMKMRASLARSLVTDPSVLLLDEPFAALDDMLRWRLNELLLKLWKTRSRTILFVTHNIAEAIFLSQRIAVMHRGKIVKWIEIDFGIPRDDSLRASTEFAKMYGKVSSELASASHS